MPFPLPPPLRRPGDLRAWAVGRVARWGEESAHGSRRNAMVAGTALAQRRAEAREVEDYLASLRVPAPRPAPHADAGEAVRTGH